MKGRMICLHTSKPVFLIPAFKYQSQVENLILEFGKEFIFASLGEMPALGT
jgi:hypothetical protein